MEWMMCMGGEPDQLAFLDEISALGAGIELGSYGLVGVRSEQDWAARFAQHQAVRAQFPGRIAVHGPFLGMEYIHMDHLIREAVHRRLEMTYDVAVWLKASRVVLHSGYTVEHDLFGLQDSWLEGNIAFWRQEIPRWVNARIQIVLENDIEKSPDLLVRLVNEVDSPSLGLCLDIGHQHVFSDLGAPEWVRRMGQRLCHIHLHDNDGTRDSHWSIGRGTIDFESVYSEVLKQAPQATFSIEVEDKMEVKMRDLHNLVTYFAANQSDSQVL